jgi:superfamily I DNA/RNA helicase
LRDEQAARTTVFVDELQDTDPAQVELLGQLTSGGADLVAVGDPDQSIYGFRGADPRVIHEFPTASPQPTGARAGRGALDLPALGSDAARCVAEGRGRLGGAVPGRAGHRALAAADGLPPGAVEVHTFRSAAVEAGWIAGRLREAHLRDGVPWSDMAVLVRSVATSAPVLRRALAAAGVPVELPADEVALGFHPAVRPLLRLIECAVRPERLDETTAEELLSSPLGGADVLTLRRLRRELRRIDGAAGGARSSGVLLVEALDDPRMLVPLERTAARPAARVAELLRVARTSLAAPDATVETVLWAVWSASGLGPRWERSSAAGGPAGAAADRDLDGVVALFDAAARFVDRLPGARLDVFLDAILDQAIASDTLAPARTGADRGAHRDRPREQGARVGRRVSRECRRGPGPTSGSAARSLVPSGWSSWSMRAATTFAARPPRSRP